MPTRGILPVGPDRLRISAVHARPLWLLACLRQFLERLLRSAGSSLNQEEHWLRGSNAVQWWRREPRSGRALLRLAGHVVRGIERAALPTGRCAERIYPKCQALRSFADDERTALEAVHDLHPSILPTSPRLVSQGPGSLLEATTMGRLPGTR